MNSIWRALLQLADGDHAGMSVVLDHIERRVRGRRVRSVDLSRLTDEERDDLAMDVVERVVKNAALIRDGILKRNPSFAGGNPPSSDAPDRVTRGYLDAIIEKRWLDILRKRNRDPLHRRAGPQGEEQSDPLDSVESPTDPDHEASALLDVARATITDALAAFRDSGRAVDMDLLAVSHRQLVELASGVTDMRTFVQEELAATGEPNDPANWQRARERLYKRHRDARRYLDQALDGLAKEPSQDPEAIHAARMALAHALKRRRTNRGPIAPPMAVSMAYDDEEDGA